MGWFQVHDGRGRLLGIFDTRHEAEEWARRNPGVYRLDYWYGDAAGLDETGEGFEARVQGRYRLEGADGVATSDRAHLKGGA